MTAQVLLCLAVVIAAAQLGGALFRRLGQPPVVGEVLAGIALGPSLLGAVAPGASAALLPAAAQPFLDLVAQLGLVVFMLLVGLEVDLRVLRQRSRLVAAVAGGSLALPAALGAGLALLLLATGGAPDGVPPAAFAVFVATALAVTAFPVLARILRDRGLAGTELGAVALATAAVTDVVAWTALAVAVSLVAAAAASAGSVVAGLVGITAAVLGVVRPLVALAARRGVLDRVDPRALLGLVLAAALLAAWATSQVGLHSAFGPFLLGLALPRHAATVASLQTRLSDVSTSLLLPPFFVVTGLGVDLGDLRGPELALLALVVVLAITGKVVGAAVPARLAGAPRRDAVALGVLLSTRGLTELVVLDVGRTAGLIDARLHGVLVATAVITTVATGPLLALVERGRPAVLVLPPTDLLPPTPPPPRTQAPPVERTPA